MFLNLKTNQYPVTEQQIRLENPNVSFGIPFQPTEDYVYVFPVPAPVYNPITEQIIEGTPAKTSKGHYEQVYSIQALPPEVIAEKQAAKDSMDEALVQQKIEALWKAADSYVSSYISGVAIGLLTIGVMQQKPKALAVTAWSSAVWDEYYVRKALITPTSQDNLDFSSFGSMPYTVPELKVEIGL